MDSIELRAAKWASSGDTGASSKALCRHMLGELSDGSYPHDPADLGRCLRLLAVIPEWTGRMDEMRAVSPYWKALAERWGELWFVMTDEVGIDWSKGRSAPKTYALMRSILDPITDADPNVFRFGGVTIGAKA